MARPRPAPIPPVEAGLPRPRWSVMIPTYHCAEYLRQTLAGVLTQDPGPEAMQIEVVDDHSTRDDPAAVVEELGRGRVGFYRQPENVGHVRNFNTCLRRSRGEIVHVLHGDDYVRPGFYERLDWAFREVPDLGAAFTRHVYVDETAGREDLSLLEQPEPGVLADWLRKIAAGQRIATPSIAVRRAVYERLGGFDGRVRSAGEDWEMWVRIAAHYPVWFEPEPLAAYRVKRPGALTDEAAQTGRLVRDMRVATEIIESYLPAHLPAEEARALTRYARGVYAGWALEAAGQTLDAGRWGAAATQAWEALRCSPTRRTFRALVGLVRRPTPQPEQAHG